MSFVAKQTRVVRQLREVGGRAPAAQLAFALKMGTKEVSHALSALRASGAVRREVSGRLSVWVLLDGVCRAVSRPVDVRAAAPTTHGVYRFQCGLPAGHDGQHKTEIAVEFAS